MNVEVTSFSNTFVEYLCSFVWFDNDRLLAMMNRYFIGATNKGEPIFWHIDAEHHITNGHIITMNAETGKVYDSSWYYSDGRPMCLFGEHLLTSLPDSPVVLVKDEMTAAIMSCFPTPYIWLAIGKDMLTSADLTSLRGKKVIVFPDKGEYGTWKKIFADMPFYVSDVMENTQGDYCNIAQVMLSKQSLRPTDEEAALMRMEQSNPNLTRLVDALGLEVIGFVKPKSVIRVKTRVFLCIF